MPCSCGRPARYAGRHRKTVLSALGPLALCRAYYHCSHCERGFFPRDRALGLAGSSLSPAVTRMAGNAAARVSFQEAAALLSELAGSGAVVKRTIDAACPAAAGRSGRFPLSDRPPTRTRVRNRTGAKRKHRPV